MTLAYANDAARKSALIQSMQEHRRLDRLHQGATGANDRGCAVACAYQTVTKDWNDCYSHQGLADHVGLHRGLVSLIDRIFEGLPVKEAGDFAEAWIEALPVGADTTGIWPRLHPFIMRYAAEAIKRAHATLVKVSEKYKKQIKPRTLAAVQTVLDLIAKHDAGETITRDQWRSAAYAAYVAYAAYAAYAADAAYAASAADAAYAASAASAAYAASAADAAYAAYAADTADAAYAADTARQKARHEFYRTLAAEFLATLRAAPVAK